MASTTHRIRRSPFPAGLAAICQRLSSLLLLVLALSRTNFLLAAANRVIEMSDRIVDIYPTDPRAFLIKFYAPWCHHCQELEPVWSQVAQRIGSLPSSLVSSPIIVGRIDCTRYSYVAQHFGIRGFPTILYVRGEKKVEFKGERSLEEILDFAARVSGPPVHYLDSCEQLEKLIKDGGGKVAFVNIGPEANENFTTNAASWQQYDWFYRSMETCRGTKPGVYAFKARNIVVQYDESKDGTMGEWIKKNRFPHFVKFTTGNLHLAISTRKLLVIALVEEFRNSGRLTDQIHVSFQKLAESIAYSYPNVDDRYLFGWSSALDTINSIAMHSVSPVPNLLVLNTTSIEYYLYDDGSKRIQSKSALVKWLDEVAEGKVESYGGDRYHHRFYRMVFDMLTTVNTMFRGNPVLTLLLFGLPGAFFSMIIYVTCFSEWSVEESADDGEEEEELLGEEDDDHEKRE